MLTTQRVPFDPQITVSTAAQNRSPSMHDALDRVAEVARKVELLLKWSVTVEEPMIQGDWKAVFRSDLFGSETQQLVKPSAVGDARRTVGASVPLKDLK